MTVRRVAVITGASSGIGRALAERAVRAGWNVYAVGRRASRLAELAERVRGATGGLATLTLDLRTPGAPAHIIRAAVERFGRIDVLVNNAGGVAVGPITDQPDAALYEQFETHAIVPLVLTREALPALRATKGHVFYVGSGVARIPVGTLGAYPSAKAAVRSIARIARNELRGEGIAVTYVDPGAVATEFMTRAGFAGPPPGLAASPHEVARRIFGAFTSRRPVVNAVPWQTFVVGIGEAFPALTDKLLQRAPQLVGGSPAGGSAVGGPSGGGATVELPSAHQSLKLPSHQSVASSSSSPSPAAAAKSAAAASSAGPKAAAPATALPTAAASSAAASSPAASSAATSPSSNAPASASSTAPASASSAAAASSSRASSSAGSSSAASSHQAALPASSSESVGASAFEVALRPVKARMQKLKLGEPFVRDLLVPAAVLDVGAIAMGWAGMPNKNERAVTREVLDALTAAGFLKKTGEERYVVVRTPS